MSESECFICSQVWHNSGIGALVLVAVIDLVQRFIFNIPCKKITKILKNIMTEHKEVDNLLVDLFSSNCVLETPVLRRGESNPPLVSDCPLLSLLDIGLAPTEENEENIIEEQKNAKIQIVEDCPICKEEFRDGELGCLPCCNKEACDACVLTVMYQDLNRPESLCPFCRSDMTDFLPVPKNEFMKTWKRQRGRPRGKPSRRSPADVSETAAPAAASESETTVSVGETSEIATILPGERLVPVYESPLVLRFRSRNQAIRESNGELQDLYETAPSETLMLVNFLRRHYPPDFINGDGYGTIFECCCGNGAISNVFRAAGWKVIERDLYTKPEKHNFLEDPLPTEHFDIIVTNPPYSNKKQFIERCVNSGKPYALLIPVETFFLKGIYQTLVNGTHLLFPTKRVTFLRNGERKSYANVVWLLGNFPFNKAGDHTMEFFSNEA